MNSRLLIHWFFWLFVSTQACAHDTVTVALLGDIMTGTTWPKEERPENPYDQWGELPTLLTSVDVTVANFEGSLSEAMPMNSQGEPLEKTCPRCEIYRMPPSDASVLAHMGIDAVSLANRHSNDLGDDGVRQTIQTLREQGVIADGPLYYPTQVWERQGKLWALLAFSSEPGQRDVRNIEQAQAWIKQARDAGARVIVSMHIGREGPGSDRVKEGDELFRGVSQGDAVAFAKGAIDAGAFIVFGHGPHVPRAMEIYKGRLVLYSLGNGVTYGGVRRERLSASLPVAVVTLDADSGQLLEGRIHSFSQNTKGPVQKDEEGAAAQWIRFLTARDRPETRLCWFSDGRFVPLDRNPTCASKTIPSKLEH